MNIMYFRSPSIEAAPLQDETILLNPDKNQFCLLNRTASFIWNLLAVSITPDSLADAICRGFSGVEMQVAMADSDRTLQELLSLKFVESRAGEPSSGRDSDKISISSHIGSTPSDLPAYECPCLTVMSEAEVLSAFQVPVVAGSWWI